MGVKHRVQKLEKKAGVDLSHKHFLFVGLEKGETPDEGLARVMEEQEIAIDQVGHALFMGHEHGITEQDFENHAGVETLQGNREFEVMLRQILDEMDGNSLGLPGPIS